MKTAKLLFIVALTALILSACGGNEKKGSTTLKTLTDSLSYCMGVQTANFLEADIDSFKMAIFEKGVKDSKGKKSVLTDEQIGKVMRHFMEAQKAKMSVKNLADAKKFLAENKKKPGVITTASGLQYTVLKEGTGPRPVRTDVVKVHYHGTFLNGKVFDSSVQRGQPVDIPLASVIPGWTEGIPLMTVGSKYRFFISPELGYGANGMGPIEPNQCLIFDVELFEIVKTPPPSAMKAPARKAK